MHDNSAALDAGQTRSFKLPAFVCEQRLLVAVAVAFILVSTLLFPNPALLTLPVMAKFFMTSIIPVFYAVIAMTFYQAVTMRSLGKAVDHTFANLLNRQNLARAIPTVALLGLFLMNFTGIKAHIPDINPFSWDPYFASLDQWMHFGIAPWRLIESVTGYGLATVLIDKLYYLWFPVFFLAVGVAATSPDSNRLRMRFLLSFVASWIIIGVFFAILFSSAGPIFHDRLLGTTSDFAVMTAHLERINAQTPLNTILVRDGLWQLYASKTDAVVAGISAMPSMHNAICVLIFLAARHVHHLLAVIAGVFAGLIFMGSVHLGWHYAIDAYVSAILVLLIWKAVGWHLGEPEQA